MIALLGCQNAGDGAAIQARGEPPAEEAVASEDYPLLQTVPPRPQLSYTVQQQREIVEALIADRENARYTSQVVRYRSGLSSLPPPPAPPGPEVTEAPEPTAPGGEASIEPGAAKPQESLLRAETFDDFLRALSRRFLSEAPEPEAAEPAPPPHAPAPPIEHDAAAQMATPDVAFAAGAVNDPADEAAHQAPHPPTETAVAARQAAGAERLIVSLPLPPTQTAVAAREAADPRDRETGTPIPAPRPDPAAGIDPIPASMPAPPPGKPPRPLDGRSAAVAAPQAVASTAAFTVQPTHFEGWLPSIAGKAAL